MKNLWDKFIHRITLGGNMGVAAGLTLFTYAFLLIFGVTFVSCTVFHLGKFVGWW